MQHPCLARPVAKRCSNGVAVRGAEEWVSAADLVPGDLVRVGLGWARDDVADELTPHEAWSLGLLVGDGCTATKNTPVISAWDTSVRARIEVGYELRATGKGHDYRMLGVRALCDRHGLIGKRAWEKRIPDAVMAGSAKIQAAFLS